MDEGLEHQHLRVLIANHRSDRLDYVTRVVVSLGHEVVARSIEVDEVAAVTGRERPDVALVGLGESSDHALKLIGEIVRQSACPVITLLETDDHAFVSEAAKRGVFAYITDTDPRQLQDAIEIALRRFAEFQNLEGAFGRRAAIERAKGILMERHNASEEHAFEMLRSHARNGNRKLVDVVAAVVDGHSLLPGPSKSSSRVRTPAASETLLDVPQTAGRAPGMPFSESGARRSWPTGLLGGELGGAFGC